jgi:ElaB/YqjD/DUF883 family membrane-anchored ribosome-binding protein
MDTTKLRETLQTLHAELAESRSVDQKTREHLRALMADIQSLLEQPGDRPTQEYRPLRERLADSLSHFDASHPKLATAIANTLDSLALLGL